MKSWNRPVPIVKNLHDKKIKEFTVKIYRLCLEVRGWIENEKDKMYNDHKKSKKLSFKLTDKEETILIKEQLQFIKQRIIKKS